MDELTQYRQIIKDTINEYAQYQPAQGEVEIETIFDDAKNHYELMYNGWNGPYRLHGSVLHIDIRNDKVWIQYDGTEEGVANKLVEAGIPKNRIVLAYKSPKARQHLDFALA